MDAISSENKASCAAAPCRAACWLLLALCFPIFWMPSGLRAETSAHKEAIQLARSGDFQQSIEQLSDLYEQSDRSSPYTVRLQQDLGVVHAWSGDHATAVELLSATPVADQPEYVLDAYANALHRSGRLSEAELAFSAWQSRSPEKLKPALGRFYTLMDAGQPEAAAEQLAYLRLRFDDPAVSFAAAYLARENGRYVEALRQYIQVLEQDPQNVDALRGKALVALDLGAPWRALALADQHPGILSEDELERARLDTAAHQLRWSSLAATSEAEQIALSRDAARIHDDVRAGDGSQALTPGDPIDRALLFDSLVALTTQYDMAGAVELFESRPFQQLPPSEVPPYVLAAAAEAYLQEGQPLTALELFRAALEAEPDSFEAKIGMFYAFSDMGRYGEADQVLSELLAAEPSWIRPSDSIWLENPRYADAVRLNAISPAYHADYSESLRRLDALLEIAPADTNARAARAQVLGWRGWPRAALKEANRTLVDEPLSTGARTARFHALMDLYRFDRAEQELLDLRRYARFNSDVRRATERWNLHKRAEFTSEAGYARSDGTAIASDQWTLESHLFSAPIRTHYRLFAHDLIRKEEFVEGNGRDHRLGAGVEYRDDGVRLMAEVSGGFEDNDDPGLSVDGLWRLTDRFSAGGTLSLNSPDVPLRATRVGIKGNELSLNGTHRWDERRSLAVAGSLIDMDDGNVRSSLGGSFAHRLLTRPRTQLDGRIGAYASRNSGGEKIYFNPEQDLSLTVGLDHSWRILARYDRALTQIVGIDVGNYWQESYGSGFIWTLRLEHQWQISQRLNFSYGATTGARVYDGDQEDLGALFLTLRSLL